MSIIDYKANNGRVKKHRQIIQGGRWGVKLLSTESEYLLVFVLFNTSLR